ncbi:hypothetical protein HLK59_41730 [Streptomyces sp. S3(2020)]|uniref:hypothetical protein n=1 Tax=Streptomyces sp. S3(2020) TaxID=2732044 RepID=UPI001487F860|nr:hypothetical protein [Streptomyces sp. S3(2020)]NNN36763.1 hypothetical protein [Streptomyces sp. S3(2020)]
MRTTRALAASAAAVAALGLAAPAAVARDGMPGGSGSAVSPSNIVALPSVIARGGQLTITVDNCPNGGTASSPAFTGSVTLSAGSPSTGTATVSSTANPGQYSITVNCTNRSPLTRSDAFTVIGGVRGGLGGSSSTGATPTDMAIGGGLVAAAAIGGGVFWMRRRAEKRI